MACGRMGLVGTTNRRHAVSVEDALVTHLCGSMYDDDELDSVGTDVVDRYL